MSIQRNAPVTHRGVREPQQHERPERKAEPPGRIDGTKEDQQQAAPLNGSAESPKGRHSDNGEQEPGARA